MILSFILAAALAVGPATPEHISEVLSEQLLSTDARAYAPVGLYGRKLPYGNGTHVQYSVVSLWVNAIECARLTGNDVLVRRLCDKYEPFAAGEVNSLPPEHVDYTIYGALPLEVYIVNGDKRALKIGLEYADAEWAEPVEGQICTNHGNFPYEEQHKLWEQGLSPQSRIWVDDLYMITLVQIQAYRATGDRKYLDRAVHTMEYYLERVMLPNGLCYHAPDVPFVWGRGMGWVAGGLTLLLDNLPEDSPERAKIVGYYRRMASSLLAAQRENGLWGQLVLDPESWDETSCSAMFAYAFAVGINRGFLDEKAYRPAVRKAWDALVRHLDQYGNLSDVCGGTDRRNSREWYMNRPRVNGDPHGQAPLMWLALELIKSGRKSGNDIPDFSRVGYHYGDDVIPSVPVVKTLHAPGDGADASDMIQEAIDGMTGPGAILLKAGKYNVGRTIRINRSGVVLRGEGDATVLYGTKRSMYDLIQVGTRTKRHLDSLSVADVVSDAVSGQLFVEVDRPELFGHGDRVVIFRPGTPEWIHAIGMDRMEQIHSTVGIVVRQWQPEAFNLYWERKVMKVEGRRVYLDNPVVMELEKRFGGAKLMKCSVERVSEVGIENMSFDCAYDRGPKDKEGRCIDENHAWSAISVFAAEHCWIRKIKASHFGYSLVHLRDLTKNVTVRDCSNLDPVSRVRGQRRYGYCLERCELCLVENCGSDKDRHGPVTQARTCGPNVFVNFTMTGALSDAGPHYKWSQGTLYDNVRTDGALTVQDRGGEGYGHGWTGCNIWMWNCEAAKIVCQNVYGCHKNFCVGCIGEKIPTLFPKTIDEPRPDGVWVSHGKHVKPASLYYSQLKQRRKEGVRIYE